MKEKKKRVKYLSLYRCAVRSRSPPIFDVWTDGRPSRARREERRRRTCGYFLLHDCGEKKPETKQTNKKYNKIFVFVFKMPFFVLYKKHTNDSQQVISNRIQLTFYMYKLIFASSLMSPVFVKWGVDGGEGGTKCSFISSPLPVSTQRAKTKKKEVWWWWRRRGGRRKSFKVRNF